jgi:hypothetical protein
MAGQGRRFHVNSERNVTPEDALVGCLRIFAARGRRIREAAGSGAVASQEQDPATGDSQAEAGHRGDSTSRRPDEQTR